MSAPLDVLSEAARTRLRKQRHPSWVPPMLATLTDEPFSHPDWLFERKLDGIRILAFRSGGTVRLLSRNKLDAGASYPDVVAALARQRARDFVIDGEVVAYQGSATSFSLLQRRRHLGGRSVRIVYHVFDVVHAGGYDTRALTVLQRKTVLRAMLEFDTTVRHTTHRRTRGEHYLAEACAKGWEGLIAKRADAPYASARSKDWLKLKCSMEQEFVVGGFTEPRGSREGFGALLLGYYDGGALRYAGDVGTGFDRALLRSLSQELARLETDRTPFTGDKLPRAAHWVKPSLVAQVAFTEWTRDGKLRHPTFKGLRADKQARDVVRE